MAVDRLLELVDRGGQVLVRRGRVVRLGRVVRRLQVLERLVQVVAVVVRGGHRPRGRQRPRRARPADRGRQAQTHAEHARARHEEPPVGGTVRTGVGGTAEGLSFERSGTVKSSEKKTDPGKSRGPCRFPRPATHSI